VQRKGGFEGSIRQKHEEGGLTWKFPQKKGATREKTGNCKKGNSGRKGVLPKKLTGKGGIRSSLRKENLKAGVKGSGGSRS